MGQAPDVHNQELDLSEEVHHKVAKRMKQLPVFTETTTVNDSMSEDEEQPITLQRKPLKSGMHQTGTHMVVGKVTWPHKVVYTKARKPAAYQNMSLPLFM